jgi:BirA family transcriptional regulator, biotin operon repressor / biotin---[acetyl-CoA-carboxylase] ligase
LSSKLPMSTNVPSLNLSLIESRLKTARLGCPTSSPNELWHEIDSTNSRALLLAQTGASDGLMVLAKSQTAGRGRFGRTWISPPESGLYLSFLLRPKAKMATWTIFTIATGLAAAKAIQVLTGTKIGLKWVNDLVFAGQKLGGILTEVENKSQDQTGLVIGIGINITSTGVQLPEELSGKVAWLGEITQQSIDSNQLVCQIAYELEEAINLIETGNTQTILDGWRSYSVTLGEKIATRQGNEFIEGVAVDITDSGALVVQTAQGQVLLHSGEISIRKADGAYA